MRTFFFVFIFSAFALHAHAAVTENMINNVRELKTMSDADKARVIAQVNEETFGKCVKAMRQKYDENTIIELGVEEELDVVAPINRFLSCAGLAVVSE